MSSKVKAPKQFTIKRSKWARGANVGGETALLDKVGNGKMCCLGFFSMACGLTESQIANCEAPEDLSDSARNKLAKRARWLLDHDGFDNSEACSELVEINDNKRLRGTKREKAIAAKFKSHGITVRFVA